MITNILQTIYIGVITYYLYGLHYDVRKMEYEQAQQRLGDIQLREMVKTLQKRVWKLEMDKKVYR